MEAQLEKNSNKEKKVKILSSGVQVVGKMDTISKGRKRITHKGKALQNQQVMHKNVAFEALNGLECKKRWQETLDTHEVRNFLRSAECQSTLGHSNVPISYQDF